MGLESLPKFRRNYLIDLYGEETLKELCVAWPTAIIDQVPMIEDEDGGTHPERSDFVTKHLKNLTCPVLVVHGLKDNFILPKHAYFIKKQVPHAKYNQ
jgi:pimeloyl-ACP methyl ester carboxylesterase